LLAVATAQTNPAVQAIASTPVEVPAIEGLAAAFAPESVVAAPGSVERLVFRARNTGNTELDVRIFITGTDGPVEAELVGLDGAPTPMIEGLRLPPFSSADLAIDAELLAAEDADVTARVELSDDDTVAATATGHLVINPCGPGDYDIDLDGQRAPLTDALLVLRRLFGFSGTTLTSAALGPAATRTNPVAVASYVDCIAPILLDLDGDGLRQPLTDGLMLLRYLFGFRGAVLIANAVDEDCTRCDAPAIEGFVEDVLAGE
jgi:hypothetical protein